MPCEHLDPAQVLVRNPYIHYWVEKRLEVAESTVTAACSSASSSSSSSSSAAAGKQSADQRGTLGAGGDSKQHNSIVSVSARVELESHQLLQLMSSRVNNIASAQQYNGQKQQKQQKLQVPACRQEADCHQLGYSVRSSSSSRASSSSSSNAIFNHKSAALCRGAPAAAAADNDDDVDDDEGDAGMHNIVPCSCSTASTATHQTTAVAHEQGAGLVQQMNVNNKAVGSTHHTPYTTRVWKLMCSSVLLLCSITALLLLLPLVLPAPLPPPPLELLLLPLFILLLLMCLALSPTLSPAFPSSPSYQPA